MPSSAPNSGTAISENLAWKIWGLGATFYAFGFFLRVSPSVMVDELMSDLSATAGAVGGLSASYLYAYAGLQIPIGIMLDRWGSRRVFVGAALLCALGGLLFGVATSLGVAHIGRILLGAGSGVAWVGCLKLAALWFPLHRFAFVSGIGLTFGMTGAVFGQGPLAAAVDAIGWRGTMLVGAVIAGALAVGLARIPNDPVPAQPDATLPEGARAEPSPSVLRGIGLVLRNRQTWYAASYGSLMTVPMLGFAALWGVPYLVERFGVTRPVAGAATSLLLVGWGLGSPLYGWWSGRTGHRRRLMILGASANLATIATALYAPGLPFAVVAGLLLLNGLASGSMPLCFAVARSHQPEHLAASTFGFANTLVIALAAVMQPVIGMIMDATWEGALRDDTRAYSLFSYHAGLLVVPACVAAAIGLAILLRESGPTSETPSTA